MAHTRAFVVCLCVALVSAPRFLDEARAEEALAAWQTRTPPPARGDGAIRGRVTADGARPLRGAQVTLSSDDLREPRTARTDQYGAYEFGDLPAAEYVVYASKPGYVGLRFGARGPREPGRPVQVADGAIVEHVDVTLPRAGVISGRIVDEYGEPVPDVVVQASRFQSRNGTRRLVAISRRPKTDDRGEYRIFGLLPGSYFVSAEPPTLPEPTAEPALAGEYLPTYYPGTPDLAAAVRVPVGVGEEHANTDVLLTPTRAAEISGTAVDASGAPVTGARVTLVRPEGRLGFMPVQQARVRGDGSFDLSRVGPGSYTLAVWAYPGGARTEPEFGSLPLVIDGRDVADLRLQTARGGRARGRVRFEDETPAGPAPSNVEVTAPLATVGFPSPSGRTPATKVAPDLSFELEALVGPRFLRVTGLPAPWSLKRVSYQGVDVTDNPLTFTANAEATGIEIVLTTRGATAAGAVRTRTGDAAGLCSVIVFAADDALWTPHTRFVRVYRADREGRFRVQGLPPGDYLAAAIDYVWQGEWTDPDFLEQLRQRAYPFSLREGERQSLTLTFLDR